MNPATRTMLINGLIVVTMVVIGNAISYTWVEPRLKQPA